MDKTIIVIGVDTSKKLTRKHIVLIISAFVLGCSITSLYFLLSTGNQAYKLGYANGAYDGLKEIIAAQKSVEPVYLTSFRERPDVSGPITTNDERRIMMTIHGNRSKPTFKVYNEGTADEMYVNH